MTHLTSSHVTTPERDALARELHSLSYIFRRILNRHYTLGKGLEDGIELLDAYLTESINAYDEFCGIF